MNYLTIFARHYEAEINVGLSLLVLGIWLFGDLFCQGLASIPSPGETNPQIPK